jgi:hypothetical protein
VLSRNLEAALVDVVNAHRGLSEQSHKDQNEDDHEQHMHEIAGLRNPWNACGPEVPQKPEKDEDDDEEFEHGRFLSIA